MKDNIDGREGPGARWLTLLAGPLLALVAYLVSGADPALDETGRATTAMAVWMSKKTPPVLASCRHLAVPDTAR